MNLPPSARTESFVTLLNADKIVPEDIHDFIDDWHSSTKTDPRRLPEFLGLTEEEFDLWIIAPRMISEIAKTRSSGINLTQLVLTRIDSLNATPDSASQAELYSLSRWLQARGITT